MKEQTATHPPSLGATQTNQSERRERRESVRPWRLRKNTYEETLLSPFFISGRGGIDPTCPRSTRTDEHTPKTDREGAVSLRGGVSRDPLGPSVQVY